VAEGVIPPRPKGWDLSALEEVADYWRWLPLLRVPLQPVLVSLIVQALHYALKNFPFPFFSVSSAAERPQP